MSEDNVNLESALGNTAVAEKKTRKKKVSRKLPQPELPEGKRQYEGVLEVNPETHSLPPVAKFNDPLDYWKTREAYAEQVKTFSHAKVEELQAQSLEQRLAHRKAAAEQAAINRAINNDAVKQALAANPELLLSGLAPEKLAAMVSQLQAMLAEKTVE